MKWVDAFKIGMEVMAHLEMVYQTGGPVPFDMKSRYRGKRMETVGATRIVRPGEEEN
jgi:hypothetical protein